MFYAVTTSKVKKILWFNAGMCCGKFKQMGTQGFSIVKCDSTSKGDIGDSSRILVRA